MSRRVSFVGSFRGSTVVMRGKGLTDLLVGEVQEADDAYGHGDVLGHGGADHRGEGGVDGAETNTFTTGRCGRGSPSEVGTHRYVV